MKWWIGPNDEYQVEARRDGELVLLDMQDGTEIEASTVLTPFWYGRLCHELTEEYIHDYADGAGISVHEARRIYERHRESL